MSRKAIAGCIARTFVVAGTEVVIALDAHTVFAAGVTLVALTLRTGRLADIFFADSIPKTVDFTGTSIWLRAGAIDAGLTA